MKMNELRILSHEDLKKKLNESQQELRSLRFHIAAGQLKTVHKVSQLRTMVARIHTLLKQ